MDVVERYLAAIAGGDWDALRAVVAENVVRIGPYGDVYEGRESYVGFLSAVMPTLHGYAMDVTRVTYVDDGRRAYAELSETVTMDGRETVTPEVLVVDLDAAGLVVRVEIFTRRA
jgi:ketosteroid isomerase-like protein